MRFFRIAAISSLALLIILTGPISLASYLRKPATAPDYERTVIGSNRNDRRTPGETLFKLGNASFNDVYGKLPLSFEANLGQTDPQVKFLSRAAGFNLFLTSSEAIFSIAGAESVLRMKLVDASGSQTLEGLEQLPGKSNYFIGNDPKKWRTNIPSYARVRHRNVYDGIDLIYYGHQQELEYDFVVAPGAEPGAIKLIFEGMQGLSVDSNGDLLIDTAQGQARHRRPKVYQEINGVRREIGQLHS